MNPLHDPRHEHRPRHLEHVGDVSARLVVGQLQAKILGDESDRLHRIPAKVREVRVQDGVPGEIEGGWGEHMCRGREGRETYVCADIEEMRNCKPVSNTNSAQFSGSWYQLVIEYTAHNLARKSVPVRGSDKY